MFHSETTFKRFVLIPKITGPVPARFPIRGKPAVKNAYSWPWTPTTHGKMKVLISQPQNMGEITTKNEGNVGSHGTCRPRVVLAYRIELRFFRCLVRRSSPSKSTSMLLIFPSFVLFVCNMHVYSDQKG